MLDPKLLRQQPEETARALRQRGFILDVALINKLEEKRRLLQVAVQKLQSERNQCSREIGCAKSRGEDISQLLISMPKIGGELEQQEQELKTVLSELNAIYNTIPNLPHETVPQGVTSDDNVELRSWGNKPIFDFMPKDHALLGANLQQMDFAAAAKITGARFVVLYGGLAKLQRALIRFMLDVHTKEHGYQEVYVPHLVNSNSLFGTGQLPKFGEDLFNISGAFPYSLIPTAEVSLTNLIRNEIIPGEKLPIKYVTHTPCYRSEAGSYGRDLHGMIRQHQFEKVELVRCEIPENSCQAHEELTLHAEKILQKLELPYRVVALCAGDLGFCAAKTYDLEVWLPAQNCYREISSCSNCTTFQARRMQARFRNPHNGKIELVHTLNGSGLAVGRTLIAILENYQRRDGSIGIPQALWSYMDGEQQLVLPN
jgi:seryl-tRNA synthetase